MTANQRLLDEIERLEQEIERCREYIRWLEAREARTAHETPAALKSNTHETVTLGAHYICPGCGLRLKVPPKATPAAECPPDETQIHVCENCAYPWKPVRLQCPICGFPAGGERTAVTPDGCTFCGGPHWESQCRYNR